MYKQSLTICFIVATSLGSAVSAESYFTRMTALPSKPVLELGEITSDGNGVVEVYSHRLGEQGELLGTVNVNRGANTDVRLNVGIPPHGDILVLLTIDGEVVARKVYDVADN